MAWALQDAKARFNEVVERAQTEGPQEVTVHGEPMAIVISKVEYEEMKAGKAVETKKSFEEFLLEGEPWPDDFVELVNQRSQDQGRELQF